MQCRFAVHGQQIFSYTAFHCSYFQQDKTFSDALDWYNYSLSLFHSNGGGGVDREAKGNLPKLHRNRANCYIGLQQLPQVSSVCSKHYKIYIIVLEKDKNL